MSFPQIALLCEASGLQDESHKQSESSIPK